MSRGSPRDWVAYLLRTICIVAAVLLGAGLGTFRAFGDTNPIFVRFSYGLDPGGGGSVDSSNPLAKGITFSGLSLHNVGYGGFLPGLGHLYGPWPKELAPGWPNNPSDPWMSFTISAPPGYQVQVDYGSTYAPTTPTSEGSDRFEESAPGSSVQIKFGFVYNRSSPSLPLSSVYGTLTLRQIVPGTDTIRFYPRLFHTDRMIGGVFEGTNGDPVAGTRKASGENRFLDDPALRHL
jgi:hypothetical protein